MMWYVYVDWTQEDVPRPFYVGKGTCNRVRSPRRNKKHRSVVRRYGHHRDVIMETDDETYALETEIFVIWTLGTHNPDVTDYSDVNCNHTLGGEGVSGFHLTGDDLSRRNLSIKSALNEPRTRERLRVAQREAQSRADVRRRHVDAFNVVRDAQRVATRAAMQRPDVRRRMCEGNKRRMCAVDQLTLDGVHIATFESQLAAQRATGVAQGNIRKCCSGEIRHSGGFLWRFHDRS